MHEREIRENRKLQHSADVNRNRAKQLYIKRQQKRHCRNLQPGYRSKFSRMTSQAARVVGTSEKTWRMETRLQKVDVHYDNNEVAPRRGRGEGQDSTFSDLHRTWIRWFKRRQAVP